MSVSKLREATEKKGCQVAVWLVMVVCLIGLTWTGISCFFHPAGMLQTDPSLERVVFTVNGKEVKLASLQRQMDDARGAVGAAVDPQREFAVYAIGIAGIVRSQVANSVAVARGISIDDSRILSMASSQFDDSVRRGKEQAIADKKLVANATDQQFQQYVEKQSGHTIAENKEAAMQKLKDALADPSLRDGVVGDFVRQALLESLYSSITVTEEEVRRSYDGLSFKYVSFDKQEMTDAQRKAQAEQALAEIKGGADFDAVTKKYMALPPKEPMKLRRSTLDLMGYLKPLGDLKVGDVSGVIVEPGSVYKIYKLVQFKSELPEDFETGKALYINTSRQERAQRAFSEAIEAGVKVAKIEWKSKGLEAVYKVYSTLTDSTLSEDGAIAKLLDVLDNTVVAQDDPAGPQAAKYARFGAVQQLETRLPADKLSALTKKKIDVINDLLLDVESVGLRLVLVDAYLQTGDNVGAVASLKLAAQNNTGFEKENEDNFSTINQKLNQLETEKKISDVDAAEIRNTLLDWSKSQAENAKLQNQQGDTLDQFAIDPKTGKTYGEEAKEKAAGATTGGTATTTGTASGGAAATTGGKTTSGKGK